MKPKKRPEEHVILLDRIQMHNTVFIGDVGHNYKCSFCLEGEGK